jgi:hypothetical protein
MIDTRRPALTEDQMREVIREIKRHGGQISIQESGLSKVQTWVNLAIGSAVITVCGWVIVSVNELKVAVTVSARENIYLKEQLQDLRDDFRDHMKNVVRLPADQQEKR